MSNCTVLAIAMTLLACVVTVTVVAGVAVWNECRAAGHSRLYCSRMVMR